MRLARWLGIYHRVGSDMCYWLITGTGKLVPKISVKYVTTNYYLKPDNEFRVDGFNIKLT